MIMIPCDIWSRYEAVLNDKVADVAVRTDFKKWLRYFWDFRSKYPMPETGAEQIGLFIKHLEYPYNLVVKLLCGCGLRLFECMKLRVHNFNFDAAVLTIHDGKGQKGRTVPLPRFLMPELQAQFETIRKLHDENLEAGYAGVLGQSPRQKISFGG